MCCTRSSVFLVLDVSFNILYGMWSLNPLMPNVFSHPIQLDQFISNFWVVGWYFPFSFKLKKKILYANSREPDQTPRFAASDLVLHCLAMFHKKDARLIWVKMYCSLLLYLQKNNDNQGPELLCRLKVKEDLKLHNL